MTGISGWELDATTKSRAGRELLAFFGLTFAITFGIGVAVIFFRPFSGIGRS